MKKLLATAAFIALASTSAFAGEKDEVNAAFTNWRKALSSGKAENVVKLYDKDAILLATLAAKPLTTQEQRTEYFTKLTAKPKLTATVDEEHVKLLDEDNAVVSGLYTFRFEEAGKSLKSQPAIPSFMKKKTANG